MFIRCAFFQGNVKPGMEQAFNNYIRKELVPLWTRFPGAQEVRVLRQVESDVGDPHFGMVLSVRYPTRESIEIALASEVFTLVSLCASALPILSSLNAAAILTSLSLLVIAIFTSRSR